MRSAAFSSMLENVLGVRERRAAGRSAARKYKAMSRSWRRRTFGRRTLAAVWILYWLTVIVVVKLDLSGRWALYAGLALGMTATAIWLIPEALLPGHITNWQL